MPLEQPLRRLAAAAVALVVGMLVVVAPLAGSASAAPTATPVSSADASFLSLLNGLRSTLGLGTLTLDPQLSSVAQSWSTGMATSGTLSHNGALASQVTGNWGKLGENVGTGWASLQIFNALVASPAHLKNMTDPAYSMIGIGSVSDSGGGLWTTHVFMQPRGGSAPRPAVTTPAPTTAPKAATPRLAPAPTVPPAPKPTAAPAPATTAPTTVAAAPTTAAPPTPLVAPPAPVVAAAVPAPGIPALQPVSSTS
ncbi:MAG: CAP domain-containing protein, partial [Acidimicrobiales bacterium]